ncbi:hypothetical protein F4804DRAFT_335266 [Jackrogersella minutella]|nr:hypothetical protein F4804DRAFT_335266 [Jackrogersella minutella]
MGSQDSGLSSQEAQVATTRWVHSRFNRRGTMSSGDSDSGASLHDTQETNGQSQRSSPTNGGARTSKPNASGYPTRQSGGMSQLGETVKMLTAASQSPIGLRFNATLNDLKSMSHESLLELATMRLCEDYKKPLPQKGSGDLRREAIGRRFTVTQGAFPVPRELQESAAKVQDQESKTELRTPILEKAILATADLSTHFYTPPRVGVPPELSLDGIYVPRENKSPLTPDQNDLLKNVLMDISGYGRETSRGSSRKGSSVRAPSRLSSDSSQALHEEGERERRVMEKKKTSGPSSLAGTEFSFGRGFISTPDIRVNKHGLKGINALDEYALHKHTTRQNENVGLPGNSLQQAYTGPDATWCHTGSVEDDNHIHAYAGPPIARSPAPAPALGLPSNPSNANSMFSDGYNPYNNTIQPMCPQQTTPGQALVGNNTVQSGWPHMSHDIVHQSAGQDLYDDYQPMPSMVGPLCFRIEPVVQPERSQLLNQLTGGEAKPTFNNLMHPYFSPFIEAYCFPEPTKFGVACVSNVPYNVSRSEILALFGATAKIPSDRLEPVHIIMDFTTGKTNNCYVEFETYQDALHATNRHRDISMNSRLPRIGTRVVDVTLVTHGALMKELFPNAYGVKWDTSPYEITTDAPHSWDNFRGFITNENLTMLCKHAESSGDTSYSKGCPERPYEYMISILKKFPWSLPQHVKHNERNRLYETTFRMMDRLTQRIQKGEARDRLTPNLKVRIAEAVMSCPGFTIAQKDNVAYLMNMPENKQRFFHQPRFADLWRNFYALSIRAGVPADVIEYYVCLIRADTTRIACMHDLGRQQVLEVEQEQRSAYWGYF